MFVLAALTFERESHDSKLEVRLAVRIPVNSEYAIGVNNQRLETGNLNYLNKKINL